MTLRMFCHFSSINLFHATYCQFKAHICNHLLQFKTTKILFLVKLVNHSLCSFAKEQRHPLPICIIRAASGIHFFLVATWGSY